MLGRMEPSPGEEWVYRQRDSDPIQRVVVRRLVRGGQHPRYDVEFLAGKVAGQILEIPARRLRVLWEQRTAYEADLERRTRVEASQLTEVESYALSYIFDFLIPSEIADPYLFRTHGVVSIFDHPRLAQLTGLALDDITRDTEWFEDDGCVVVSAEGGLRVAEAACTRAT